MTYPATFINEAYDLRNPDNISNNKQRFVLLSKFIENDVFEFMNKNCKYFSNCSRLINFLCGTIDKETMKYLGSAEAGHRRDMRSPVEYAQSLIISRVVEVYILDYFKENHGRVWDLNGCDRTDIVKTDNKITYEPDFVTKTGCLIELMSDWTSYSYSRGGMHLRDNKLKHLIELSKNNSVLIMFVDIPKREYQFKKISTNSIKQGKYVEKIRQFGNKSGYFFEVDSKRYKSFGS